MSSSHRSSPRLALVVLLLLTAALAFGQSLPSPEQFFGHAIGADTKLVRWDRQLEYFQLMAKGSDRVLFQEVGKTTENNPFVLMVISSPANLKNIERYRQINRRLFDPRTIASDEEARSPDPGSARLRARHLQHSCQRDRRHPDDARGRAPAGHGEFP